MDTRHAPFDISIPFQRLRHTALARRIRQGITYAIAGKESYPFVFSQVAEGDEPPQGVSPHLYVHIPFCRSLCAHCPYNKIVFRSASYHAYRAALEREFTRYLARPAIPPIQTLYFGGGTPSMTPALIERIITLARPYFAEGAEVGVEVHPYDAAPERLEELRRMGVNRISLGIETFQEDLLRLLGRGYTHAQAEQAIQWAKAAGFTCVDVNLIYGIPGQTAQGALDDVKRCVALGVDHLSAYPLITFEQTHLGKLVAEGKLREYGDLQRARTQRDIAKTCLAQGFTRTSVWSFTRARSSAYTTVTRESYLGFGAGAGSKVDGEFWFNTFSVAEYNKLTATRPAILLRTTERFRRLHWLYWQIYTTRIDAQRYQRLFHRDLMSDYWPLILLMQSLGWARRADALVTLTDRGARWAHRFQMLFSLTFIDQVWRECQQEAWPRQIVLY